MLANGYSHQGYIHCPYNIRQDVNIYYIMEALYLLSKRNRNRFLCETPTYQPFELEELANSALVEGPNLVFVPFYDNNQIRYPQCELRASDDRRHAPIQNKATLSSLEHLMMAVNIDLGFVLFNDLRVFLIYLSLSSGIPYDVILSSVKDNTFDPMLIPNGIFLRHRFVKK